MIYKILIRMNFRIFIVLFTLIVKQTRQMYFVKVLECCLDIYNVSLNLSLKIEYISRSTDLN